ncbi:Fic family protein [Thiocapsa bogorovii]|uniref:Fic family protein n=1 Tax=Thiocapsa bogorovii TaxID=521689 RepID=UPI001E29B75B|nr:Fic family protein [Thiocapsa bogorovii]UHD15562.1 Fic family protein [Thiocapsa bogorovii]
MATESAGALPLRRVNRTRTIHGSLAIEGNTLSEQQITAILEGKPVIAPPREIQEVRNALLAYEHFPSWNPASEEDLLVAHALLMRGLVGHPGAYRHRGVGVMSGDQVVHMAPPADRVAILMGELLAWLSRAEVHPLIASCVFHYEFEFIHPFEDGNGRLGRLWQTVILSRWNRLFADLPVESIIHAHQQDYYRALADSNDEGASTLFVEFMLGVIREAVMSASTEQGTEQATEQVLNLLARMGEGDYSAKTLMALMGLSHRPTFLYDYLHPALDGGWLELTRPETPKSPKQRYRLTASGRQLLLELGLRDGG